MAMIFLSGEDRAGRRSVRVFSTIEGARTGRWCQVEAGAYPDRCDCILEDLTNGIATHFTIQYGTINGKRVAYRHGHCEKCAPEYAKGRKLHPIPKPLTPSSSPEGEGGLQAG
jgi:hypothetical protein